MIVFKHYFKIVKKFIPMILIYTFIFTFFAVVATSVNNDGSTFNTNKPKIFIDNQDKESTLSQSLTKYTEKKSEIVYLKNDEQTLKDALFYRTVDYIMIIPKGFGESIVKGNPLKIETLKVPDSYNATYMEMLLNRFLSISSVYAKVGVEEKQIVTYIESDLKEEAKVTLLKTNQNELQKINYFYNFSNYTILAITIFVIGMLINIFNDTNIKKRNLISGISYKKMNRQLFLGNAVMVFIIWCLYVLIGMILYPKTMISMNGLLFVLNLFAFSFTALSLGFLIGNLIKNREAQNGIVNIIALGSSFLCGAFVPQELLGTSVLELAKFLPSYWFIKNNDAITILSKFDFESLKPIFINMVIIILFGVAFFMITNFVTKVKRKHE